MTELSFSRRIAAAIRAGDAPTDETFDRFMPSELERVSSTFWTPIEVVMRVASWLADLEIETVMDIGSGAGKFCVVAALAGTARFVGIEQRPRLVGAARRLAQRFGVEDRVRFDVGTLEGLTGAIPANAYYLFNPFGENRFSALSHLDEDVELSNARFARDVATVETLFRTAPRGTYVITYNGFGGTLPTTYVRRRTDHQLPNVLRMWQKVSEEPT